MQVFKYLCQRKYVSIHHGYKIAFSEMSFPPSPRTDEAPADSDGHCNSHENLRAFIKQDQALKLQR